MNLPRIFIIGASGHGLVVLEAAIAQGYDVAGWVDSFKGLGTMVAGHAIVGKPNDLAALMQDHHVNGGILAISDNSVRAAVAAEIQSSVPDFRFVTVVHPSAWVSPSATLGEGSLVLAGAVVNAACRVGIHCIINTKSSLDHESEMEPFASILPGVTTGGGVKIGSFSCVCAGSILSHRVAIGRHTVVGAGSTVLTDLPSEVLAFGTPAKVHRPRAIGERHF
jgi:sugar O-acyltransferase (sialic acid O-acetyltransferase NeuD family)